MEKNREAALFWAELAAKQGSAEAQNNLGVILGESPCQKDKEEALKWFRKAAAQGFAPAIRVLKDWSAPKP